MKKVLDFLKKPAVTHTLAAVLGVVASSLASGHLDVSALLKALGAG